MDDIQHKIYQDLHTEIFKTVDKFKKDWDNPILVDTLKDLLVDMQSFLIFHNLKENSRQFDATKMFEDYTGTKKEYFTHGYVIPYELKVKRNVANIEQLNQKIIASMNVFEKEMKNWIPTKLDGDFANFIHNYKLMMLHKKYKADCFEEGLHELRRNLRTILNIIKIQGGLLYVKKPMSEKYVPTQKYTDTPTYILNSNIVNYIEMIVYEIGVKKKELEKTYVHTHIPNDSATHYFYKYWNMAYPVINIIQYIYK